MTAMSRRSRVALGAGIAGLVCAAVIVIVGLAAARPPDEAGEPLPEFPTEGPYAYRVEYLGITCGHMTLESRLEKYQGRPAYHVIMTASNAKFFNKIYRVDGQIDSWVDAETLTSVFYESVTTEKGETSHEYYEVDSTTGKVVAVEDGEESVLDFAGEQVLDPLAYVFRLHALAREPGQEITLTLLTSKGAVETVGRVSKIREKRTALGPRKLVKIQPQPVDGRLFSRKGTFSLWAEPGGTGALFVLDFDLSFGHLVAKLD